MNGACYESERHNFFLEWMQVWRMSKQTRPNDSNQTLSVFSLVLKNASVRESNPGLFSHEATLFPHSLSRGTAFNSANPPTLFRIVQRVGHQRQPGSS